MLFYFINKEDRGNDVTESSLSIKLGLNRRSNSADLELFKGDKPLNNHIIKIYHGAIIKSIVDNTLILEDSYELKYNTFRIGQELSIAINEIYEYKDVITNYNETTKTLTFANNINGSVSIGDLVGQIKFGGTVARIPDKNLHTLNNLVWPVTCVGYEKLFDKQQVSDTWVDVDARYIINDILNSTVNFNRTIDNMSYEDDTEIQSSWIQDGQDDELPEVDADKIEGEKSAAFSWTNSTGQAKWNTVFPSRDLSQFSRVGTDNPDGGFVMLWIKSSDLANVSSIEIVFGDGTDEFTIQVPFDSTKTDWQYVNAYLPLGSGIINWGDVSEASIVINQTGDGEVFFNGLRINADNSFTPKFVSPTTELSGYRSPQIRPSEIVNTLAKSFEFIWYIDFEQNIHFKTKDIQPCFYEINNTSNNFFDLETELDDTQLGNRIIIEGGDRTSDSVYSQVVQGNGAVREWIMKSKFKNLQVFEDNNTSTDTMEVGTTTTTVNATGHGLTTDDWIVNRTRNEARQVTVVNANQFTVTEVIGQTNGDTFSKFATQKLVGVEGLDADASFDYMSNFNEKSIRAAQQTNTLDNAIYLLFKYNEVVPLSIQYTDSASANALKALGFGNGIFDLEKVVDKNITDSVTAVTLAVAKTNEYSNPIITGSFATNYHGFEIADLVNVAETFRAINGEYIIQKITAKQKGGEFKDHFNYTIEFGTTLYGAIEFFQKLLSQNSGVEINTDIPVETYVDASETCEVEDENTIYVYEGAWKYEPSIGQPVPSRYDLSSFS